LELIVVMTIIGLSAAIAVPRVLLTIESVSADAEQRILREMVDQIELHAFLRQQNQQFIFKNQSVFNRANTLVMSFDHLCFVNQLITWNVNGFPDIQSLHYTFRGKEKTLFLY